MSQSREVAPVRPEVAARGGFLMALYDCLHGNPTHGAGRLIQGSLQALIFVNVAALVLESVPEWGERYFTGFSVLEQASVFLFSIEYLARVASSTARGRFHGKSFGRLRYALTPLALVDLLSIAPAFVPLLGGADLRGLRATRLMRIFRVLKLGRYSRAIRSLRSAISSRKEELAVTMFGVLILLLLAASVLHLAERDAQPEHFGTIPHAAWWTVTTLTTVGYGDVVPVTGWGKLAAGVVAILGIGLFALPAGILGSAFVDQMKRVERCPHCGKEPDSASG
jgi:voltage-gated potassium channel